MSSDVGGEQFFKILEFMKKRDPVCWAITATAFEIGALHALEQIFGEVTKMKSDHPKAAERLKTYLLAMAEKVENSTRNIAKDAEKLGVPSKPPDRLKDWPFSSQKPRD